MCTLLCEAPSCINFPAIVMGVKMRRPRRTVGVLIGCLRLEAKQRRPSLAPYAKTPCPVLRRYVARSYGVLWLRKSCPCSRGLSSQWKIDVSHLRPCGRAKTAPLYCTLTATTVSPPSFSLDHCSREYLSRGQRVTRFVFVPTVALLRRFVVPSQGSLSYAYCHRS